MASLGLFGKSEIPKHQLLTDKETCLTIIDSPHRQIRQGIANNSKGTAFVVYEDVHDAKQACDKLNGFNFQNRYLVGMYTRMVERKERPVANFLSLTAVLYHQPEKMVRSKEDLSERQENLERLKQQHGIE